MKPKKSQQRARRDKSGRRAGSGGKNRHVRHGDAGGGTGDRDLRKPNGRSVYGPGAAGEAAGYAERAGRRPQDDGERIQPTLDEGAAGLPGMETALNQAERLPDIGVLAATVAHELRKPLAVIQTAVYNIRKKRENKSLDKHLAAIERKIIESNQIIGNLLNYSRLEQPRLEQTSIFSLVEEHLAAVSERFPRHQVSVKTRIDSVRDLNLRVDPDQIGEVFTHILNNAYQAFEGGRGGVTVAARKDPKRRNIIVSFTDNGIGMNEDAVARAQDPFFSTKPKGLGLGLTICRNIMRLHGGSLAIQSGVGKGTTVTLSLPVR